MSQCGGGKMTGGRASDFSSFRAHKAFGQRLLPASKFIHGDFWLGWRQSSCTRVRLHLRKRASSSSSSSSQAFLRDGLECCGENTVSLDKELPAIKDPGTCCLDAQLAVSPQQEAEEQEEEHLVEKPEQVLSLVRLPAARGIVQLLTAWDTLSERLNPEFLHCNGSRLLLDALKLSIPAFQRQPFSQHGRLHLSRALEVAYILADLHMDAETIAAGILRVASDTASSVFSVDALQAELGPGTVHLLHNSLRVKQLPRYLDSLDEENASTLRQFSLAYHDVRAIVIELSSRLDSMRHIGTLPKHRQQVVALENMQVYAPLASALGLGNLSQELEDLAFRVLFPESYHDVDNWLQSHWGDGEVIISESTRLLKEALESDGQLQGLVSSVSITGRRKSRFSTMKKLLKDGRRPEQVFDILGLRIILLPKSEEGGVKACYRAQALVTKMWTEVPGRMKDYIAKPKKNGYASLHLAVYFTEYGPWSLPVEVQIRTSAMDAHAVAGAASHSLYKGGLTDPHQVQQFKAIMLAAAKAAALRLEEAAVRVTDPDHVFRMFDKNNDGIISRKEFQDVFLELGTNQADSCEVMKLIDANNDGAVTPQELEELKRQVRISRDFAGEQCFNPQLRKMDELNKCGHKHELRKYETIQLSVF